MNAKYFRISLTRELRELRSAAASRSALSDDCALLVPERPESGRGRPDASTPPARGGGGAKGSKNKRAGVVPDEAPREDRVQLVIGTGCDEEDAALKPGNPGVVLLRCCCCCCLGVVLTTPCIDRAGRGRCILLFCVIFIEKGCKQRGHNVYRLIDEGLGISLVSNSDSLCLARGSFFFLIQSSLVEFFLNFI